MTESLSLPPSFLPSFPFPLIHPVLIQRLSSNGGREPELGGGGSFRVNKIDAQISNLSLPLSHFAEAAVAVASSSSSFVRARHKLH